jgi:membrane fusion protein (multidrug efflux system)
MNGKLPMALEQSPAASGGGAPSQDKSAAPARPSAPPAAKAPAKKASPVRRIAFAVVAVVAIGYGLSYAYDWFVEGRFIVATDDAYVGASSAIMAAKIPGHIVEVAVAENQKVRAGDLLARIDPGDYQLAVDSAKAKIDTQDATLQRIDRQLELQKAMIEQAEAQVGLAEAQKASAEADQLRAQLEYDRSQKLAQDSYGSQQRLEQAAADRARTAAVRLGAEAAIASAKASLAGAKSNLDVMQAQRKEAERTRAELVTTEEKAARDLSFAEIRAPFDGVVGNKAIEIGQYAQPGVRLMAVVPLGEVYVDANFKETQLTDIRPGQRVDVAVDAMGGKVVGGTVVSIAPASGAEFALIPPDNATGNFTKVVQRIPVRIALDPAAIKDGALRPGLSVIAAVHTRDENLPRPTLLGALGFTGARP